MDPTPIEVREYTNRSRPSRRPSGSPSAPPDGAGDVPRAPRSRPGERRGQDSATLKPCSAQAQCLVKKGFGFAVVILVDYIVIGLHHGPERIVLNITAAVVKSWVFSKYSVAQMERMRWG